MRTRTMLLATAIASLAMLWAIDAVVDRAMPHFSRLRDTFSAQYVRRELATLRDRRPKIVVLGDSVLWGYGVAADRSAIALMRAHDGDIENLAYPGGGPLNSLTVFRLLRRANVRPRVLLVNVNQKTFTPLDSAFARIHPSIDEIARDQGVADRDFPSTSGLGQTSDARLDRALGTLWHFYGMRTDIRDALFGEADVATLLRTDFERLSGAARTRAAAHRPTSADFEGTYDLTPLDDANESYRALETLAREATAAHVAVLAVLTPTNHVLLHDYVDNADYRANLARTAAMLRANGARVLDLDRAFPAAAFLDNDHLTAAANVRFARLLERAAAPALT